MMLADYLTMPTLADMQHAPRPRRTGWAGRPCSVPDAIVAAIRWDYDHRLMSLAQLRAKYPQVGRSNLLKIAHRTTRAHIAAAEGDAP